MCWRQATISARDDSPTLERRNYTVAEFIVPTLKSTDWTGHIYVHRKKRKNTSRNKDCMLQVLLEKFDTKFKRHY